MRALATRVLTRGPYLVSVRITVDYYEATMDPPAPTRRSMTSPYGGTPCFSGGDPCG